MKKKTKYQIRKKKEEWKMFWKLLPTILYLMVGLVLIVYGQMLFIYGFHNFDIGQNMRFLECEFDTVLIDTGSDLMERDSTESYILGTNQSRLGFQISNIGYFLFGYGIYSTIGLVRKNG